MTKTLKPKLTECKGTVFRSKSEAIFARHLDLCGLHWVYEPDRSKTDHWIGGDHCWDFFVSCFLNCGFVCSYIEYKPSAPTDTYVQNLINDINSDLMYSNVSFVRKRHTLVGSVNENGEFKYGIESSRGMDIEKPYLEKLKSINKTSTPVWSWTPAVLVSNNFFDDSEINVLEIESSGCEDEAWYEFIQLLSNEEKASEAKKFRFDLQS